MNSLLVRQKANNAQSLVNLSPADLLAATKLEQDLKDAIAGTYAG
jgi:hypothetical protein